MRSEHRGPLRRLLRYLLISPYSWAYTAQLPYYFLRPSTKNAMRLVPLPLSQELSSEQTAVRLVVAGDIMPLNGHKIPVLSQAMRKVLNRADYLITNCESPITNQPLDPQYKSMMTFSMPLAYLDGIMAQHDLSPEQCVLTVANNHSRDCEEQAFIKGVTVLQQRGYQVVGHYDETQPFICLQAGGVKLGIAGWTHLMNGERALAKREVVYRGRHMLMRDWQSIKQQHQLHSLIGLPHWGREYQHFPHQTTYQAATQFAQQGFDMLLGCHSHVIQPAQRLGTTFCAFSLANLCSVDTHWRTHLIPLLSLELDTQGKLVRYHYDFFMQQVLNDEVHLVPLEACDVHTQQKAHSILALCFD